MTARGIKLCTCNLRLWVLTPEELVDYHLNLKTLQLQSLASQLVQHSLANLQCERRVQWRSIASSTHLLKGKLVILASQSSIWTLSRFVRHMMMLRWRDTDKMFLRKGILGWRLNLLSATLRVLSANCLNDFNMNQLHHSTGPYYWKSSTFLPSHCSICLMKEFTCRSHTCYFKSWTDSNTRTSTCHLHTATVVTRAQRNARLWWHPPKGRSLDWNFRFPFVISKPCDCVQH